MANLGVHVGTCIFPTYQFDTPGSLPSSFMLRHGIETHNAHSRLIHCRKDAGFIALGQYRSVAASKAGTFGKLFAQLWLADTSIGFVDAAARVMLGRQLPLPLDSDNTAHKQLVAKQSSISMTIVIDGGDAAKVLSGLTEFALAATLPQPLDAARKCVLEVLAGTHSLSQHLVTQVAQAGVWRGSQFHRWAGMAAGNCNIPRIVHTQGTMYRIVVDVVHCLQLAGVEGAIKVDLLQACPTWLQKEINIWVDLGVPSGAAYHAAACYLLQRRQARNPLFAESFAQLFLPGPAGAPPRIVLSAVKSLADLFTKMSHVGIPMDPGPVDDDQPADDDVGGAPALGAGAMELEAGEVEAGEGAEGEGAEELEEGELEAGAEGPAAPVPPPAPAPAQAAPTTGAKRGAPTDASPDAPPAKKPPPGSIKNFFTKQ
jgi:hypothetical protein